MQERFYAEQWGQSQLFQPAQFVPNQALPLLTITTPQESEARPPRVRTLILGVENDDDSGQSYILRWRLAVGVGGARTEVDFDATRYSRVSLPFDECRVSLYADPFTGGTDTPVNAIQAFAFCADGYAEQTHPGPIFSEFFEIVGPGSQLIPIPVGANRFRVVGVRTLGQNPLTANTEVFVRAGAASLRYSIRGLEAANPGVADLAGLYNTGDFIPLASGATELDIIQQAASQGAGFVQFGLDL